MKKQIGMSELYGLCNKEQLFTCGSINQYDKMFELAAGGITQTELAYILYVCSKYGLDTIYEMIGPLFKGEVKNEKH